MTDIVLSLYVKLGRPDILTIYGLWCLPVHLDWLLETAWQPGYSIVCSENLKINLHLELWWWTGQKSLSVCMKSFSIYLDILWFLSSEFCTFPPIGLIHILLEILTNYLIIFGTDVNSMLFNSNSSAFLAYKKAVNFCIWTLYPVILL